MEFNLEDSIGYEGTRNTSSAGDNDSVNGHIRKTTVQGLQIPWDAQRGENGCALVGVGSVTVGTNRKHEGTTKDGTMGTGWGFRYKK